MNAAWGWDPKKIRKIIAKLDSEHEPEKKFFFTDDQDEFLNRLEAIANKSVLQTKDNLRYLEQLDKIRQVREGADIYKIYPSLKRDWKE